MKKFRFKLASVEKVRRTREEEALRLLAQAQNEYQKLLRVKESMLEAIQISLLRREELGREPIPSVAFQIENEFIAGTKLRAAHLDQKIFKAQKNIEKAMRNYLLARRQTRMIEVLREREYEKFKIEVKRKETKLLDELSMMRVRLKLDEERVEE